MYTHLPAKCKMRVLIFTSKHPNTKTIFRDVAKQFLIDSLQKIFYLLKWYNTILYAIVCVGKNMFWCGCGVGKVLFLFGTQIPRPDKNQSLTKLFITLCKEVQIYCTENMLQKLGNIVTRFFLAGNCRGNQSVLTIFLHGVMKIWFSLQTLK